MFGYEKVMDLGQFLLHGGWLMFIPGLVLIFLLLYIKKKNAKTEQKVSDNTLSPTDIEVLPRWVTILTGCICLLLSSGGMWLGTMGIAGDFFGVDSTRNFYGLFEVTGFFAIILNLLFIIISVAAFIPAIILLKEGLFERQIKHE
jgi:hypothetical protein